MLEILVQDPNHISLVSRKIRIHRLDRKFQDQQDQNRRPFRGHRGQI